MKSALENAPFSDLPPRIAVVTNSDAYLYRFRAPLLRSLVESGVEVVAIAPAGPFAGRIESIGAEFVPWNVRRRSLNPISEIRSIIELGRIYRRVRPDLVQHYTVKPNLYGALAARLAGVPVVVCGVTGTGYAFTSGKPSRIALRTTLAAWYRLCAALSDRLTFQTQDDAARILGSRGLFASKARVNPGGSGVNVRAFSPDAVPEAKRAALREELGVADGSLVVTMASRLLWDKGVAEYVEAARKLKASLGDVAFLMAGSPDPGNPDSVEDSDVERWRAGGIVNPVGHVEDMPGLLSISDVVVLPSYAEGVPRALIEAAAMARPIVATDIPGARAVVEHGVNGLLVPARDSESLAHAIERLLCSEELRMEYGGAGRSKAQREFDDRRVAEWFVEEYRSLWKAKRGV